MPKSPYAAVNERRRKRAYNRRSTGQLGRRRRERTEDYREAQDRTSNPHGRKRFHGLVNTGYVASLMAERDSILAERTAVAQARADEAARAAGQVPVAEAHHPDGSYKAEAHVRTLKLGTTMREIPIERREAPPEPVTPGTVEPDGTGGWTATNLRGETRRFAYKSEAEGFLAP